MSLSLALSPPLSLSHPRRPPQSPAGRFMAWLSRFRETPTPAPLPAKGSRCSVRYMHVRMTSGQAGKGATPWPYPPSLHRVQGYLAHKKTSPTTDEDLAEEEPGDKITPGILHGGVSPDPQKEVPLRLLPRDLNAVGERASAPGEPRACISAGVGGEMCPEAGLSAGEAGPTVHPTPYILHPAPFTLHPSP